MSGNIDTPDYQRGVISATQALQYTVAGDVYTFTLPPNVTAVWFSGEGGSDPPSALHGVQSGFDYPIFDYPAEVFGGPNWTSWVAPVASAIDSEVQFTFGPTPGFAWQLIGLTGAFIVTDAILSGSTQQPGQPTPGTAVLVAGSDGTDLRALLVDATGKLQVSGTTFPAVYAPPGTALPADALYVAGSDGTDLRGLLLDSSGHQLTIDQNLKSTVGTPGSAEPSEAVQVGGSDGTDMRLLLTDSTGHPLSIDQNLKLVVGAAGAASPADAVLMAGSDGTDLRPLLTDHTGILSVVDQVLQLVHAALGSTLPSQALLAGGSDGTHLRALLTDQQGALFGIPSAPGEASGDRPPNELLWANVNNVAVNTAIVPAPGAGLRIRVFFVYAYANDATGTYLVALNNAAGGVIILAISLAAAGQTQPPIAIPLTGIACEVNTQVTLSVGAAHCGATVGYTIETV